MAPGIFSSAIWAAIICLALMLHQAQTQAQLNGTFYATTCLNVTTVVSNVRQLVLQLDTRVWASRIHLQGEETSATITLDLNLGPVPGTQSESLPSEAVELSSTRSPRQLPPESGTLPMEPNQLMGNSANGNILQSSEGSFTPGSDSPMAMDVDGRDSPAPGSDSPMAMDVD